MKRYVFSVRGMVCGMCESHVNDAVRACGPVQSVKSNRKKGQTEVVAESLNVAELLRAVRALGYDADLISEEPYAKKRMFAFLGK